jgi:hypothetical protein
MAASGRRSVQEQNQELRALIQRTAESFRRDPKSYGWLVETLMAHSQSPKNGMLARLNQVPDQLGEVCEGLWLSQSQQFFRFSVLLPRARGERMIIEDWRNVTEEMEVNAHKPGTGKTFAFLALEVQAELS